MLTLTLPVPITASLISSGILLLPVLTSGALSDVTSLKSVADEPSMVHESPDNAPASMSLILLI